jgi:hypothetical protein
MKALLLTLVMGLANASYAADTTAQPTREQVHAALDACATENNLTRPEPGVRPNDADRAVMEACLKTKGIDHLPRPANNPRRNK